MSTIAIDDTIVHTVNAPYKRAITAATLAACLARGSAGAWPAHVATFFTDVRPEDALAFAREHGIPAEMLRAAYAEMKERTGEGSEEMDAALGELPPNA